MKKYLKKIGDYFREVWDLIRFLFKSETKTKKSEETSTEVTEEGVKIDNNELYKLIRDKLSNKITKNTYISIADSQYYCPTKQVATDIVKKSMINNMKYRPQVFDCDDYAFLLKADFIKDAYYNKERRAPYIVGIVYTELPVPHALNILIDSKKDVYFIEPQTDGIILPNDDSIESIRMLII